MRIDWGSRLCMRSSICACVKAGSVYSHAADWTVSTFSSCHIRTFICARVAVDVLFSLRGKGQTQILAEFGTLWLIDRLFGCYERPRKPGHICGGDTRGNTRMTWQSRCEISFNTCLGRQAQQWNVWWFNVMLAFWLIVLSVHRGYLRSIWRLSWISLWRSKKYLFLCFSLHHLRSSYNNHKRWKILHM